MCRYFRARQTALHASECDALSSERYLKKKQKKTTTKIGQSKPCQLSVFEGCSFSDVCKSEKQEVAVRVTYNIHIPSNHLPPFRTVSVVSAQIQRYSDSRMEILHGAVNL